MKNLHQASCLKDVCTKHFNVLSKMNIFMGTIIFLLIICQRKKGSNLLAKMFPKNSLPTSSVKWHIELNSMLNHSFERKWFTASKISLDNHRGQKLWPLFVTWLFTVCSHCRLSGLQVSALLKIQKPEASIFDTVKTPTISFSSSLKLSS